MDIIGFLKRKKLDNVLNVNLLGGIKKKMQTDILGRKAHTRESYERAGETLKKLYSAGVIVSYLKGTVSRLKGKTYEEIYGKEKAEEIKKKTSLANKGQVPWSKGRKFTEEHIMKMKIALKGKNKGKHYSPLTEIKKGEHLSPATEFKKGNIPYHKGKTYEVVFGEERAKEIKKKIFSKKNRAKMLKGLISKPTSFERKLIGLFEKRKIPLVYVGDGRKLINYKNPDFLDEGNKILLEVFADYFKIRDHGSIKNYIKERGEHFSKSGYKTIFIDEKTIQSKDWEKLCLNKISKIYKQVKMVEAINEEK